LNWKPLEQEKIATRSPADRAHKVSTAEILRNCREGEDDDGRRVEDQRAAAAAAATDADANDREKKKFGRRLLQLQLLI
jgi:hypothetical protein